MENEAWPRAGLRCGWHAHSHGQGGWGGVQQVPGSGTQGVWDRVPLAPEQGNPILSPPSPHSSVPAASAPIWGWEVPDFITPGTVCQAPRSGPSLSHLVLAPAPPAASSTPTLQTGLWEQGTHDLDHASCWKCFQCQALLRAFWGPAP